MSTQANASGVGSADMSIADSLYQVKLLSALRSGDPALIHPLLAEIGNSKRKSIEDVSGTGSTIDVAAAALHLAIRCASLDTIRLLLSHRAISPNAVYPPSSGTTALHLAASLGRADVVNLLLEQDSVDDTLRDSEGRTVRDVARGRDVQKAIRDSRAILTANFRSLLHRYISTPASDGPPQDLLTLLSSPRVRLVDLSYLDPTSGRSLLHEAARRKDFRLIELSVRAGADVFVRDAKGRGVGQSVRDERVKVFLRQFTNQDTTLLDSPGATSLNEPPTLRGYLSKYTNVAKGYATRWFVLKNGVLSYYRHQEDENVASRGAISMKSATVRRSASDKLRFEISAITHGSASGSSTNTGGHLSSSHNQQKWYIKGNHVAEVNRWCVALERAIEWGQRGGRQGTSSPAISSAASTMSHAHSMSGQGHGSESEREGGGRSLRSFVGGLVHGVGASGKYESGGSKASSLYGEGGVTAGVDDGPMAEGIKRARTTSSRRGDVVVGDLDLSGASGRDASSERFGNRHDGDEYDVFGDAEDGEEEDSGDDKSVRVPPHEGTFEIAGNTVIAQVELAAQLAARVVGLLQSQTQTLQTQAPLLSSAASTSTSTSSSSVSSKSVNSRSNSSMQIQSIHSALLDSLTSTQRLVSEYVTMSREREGWWKGKLERERERGEVWEESLRVVVREGEELEKELRKRLRGEGGEDGVDKKREVSIGVTPTPSRMTASVRRTPSLALSAPLPEVKTVDGVSGMPPVVEGQASGSTMTTSVISMPSTVGASSTTAGTSTLASRRSSRMISSSFVAPGAEVDESVVDTDEEDEFFDAIESNTLPNVIVPDALAHQSALPKSISISSESLVKELEAEVNVDAAQYKGYTNLRTKLPIEKDTRPPTSLWSVLKHSIGKDLTKISFPVFFNEPTSMLQRMAEDMEFSECLDAAVAEPDPHRRIAFVAAFAMSNYSSTIGRIAKPFNPMLSETFEYVRLDKKYRYVSEQVSHHPPVSACWAESPSWHYFGEVDAQNKFMGKSFEIRPTGVAHAELMIPEKLAPHYPKAKGPAGKGKVIEHYSWKKVTTNVSGFILGSPTIDHYGDMTVVNHRTGDTCVLTFKPRGWRGKDAFEIFGHVMDANGNITYEIAGRWNSQLVARAIGTGFGVLHPDVSIGSPPSSPSAAAGSTEFILLWRNTPKPSMPFNLTPFAVTLNDCPDTLRPYLCPTDCRLRPDQRAFEIGKYERANELKQKQEEYQRATRKAREEGLKPKHRPRWFVARTEVDTGERVWEPVRTAEGEGDVEYWKERERIWKEGGHWKDVEQIFIEDEP